MKTSRVRRSFLLTVLGTLLIAVPAAAQISVTALRGFVRDPSGAVIPGVELQLRDLATGIEKTTLSVEDGGYLFTGLVEGRYRLTVVFPGFQTAVYDSIVINTGRTTDLTVELKLGETTQSVEVTISAVQLETTSTTASTTIKNTSIDTLPNSGRSSLDFALLVPGAMSANSNRNSTFNGLPNASMNITLDGMNNNSQRFKSGGTSFFAFAPMRIDAIEEVTVSTSGMGAEASG
ncbi:MAG: carboxypeptidase regulatory-like domain-containing protein, partial [Acidobacteria bacterium]|nr:carboxypeptidase regulatory-like domain-containing protein [Acidobacteriota bacterium]